MPLDETSFQGCISSPQRAPVEDVRRAVLTITGEAITPLKESSFFDLDVEGDEVPVLTVSVGAHVGLRVVVELAVVYDPPVPPSVVSEPVFFEDGVEAVEVVDGAVVDDLVLVRPPTVEHPDEGGERFTLVEVDVRARGEVGDCESEHTTGSEHTVPLLEHTVGLDRIEILEDVGGIDQVDAIVWVREADDVVGLEVGEVPAVDVVPVWSEVSFAASEVQTHLIMM